VTIEGKSAALSAGERARLQLYLLLGLSTVAAYVMGRLFWPFLPAIVTSAVVATLIWPVQRRIHRLIRRRDLAALLGTLAAFFLIVLPLGAITVALLQQLQAQVQPVTAGAGRLLAPQGRVAQWLLRSGARFGLDAEQISSAIAAQVQQVGGFLLARTMSLISGLGGWLLQAGAALFTLYYMLRDGDQLVRATRWAVPLDPAQTDRLLSLARDAVRATVLGNLVVAIVQGAIGGVAFWIVGVPGALFWGLVMGVLSLLPVVGPSFVWVPAVVLLLLNGKIPHALALAAIGALVVSTIDNVLRSLLIGGRVQLHPLAVFFSLLGGIFVFGAVGVLLGPVLFVIALTVLEMGRLALSSGGDAVPQEARPWLLAVDAAPAADDP
jgi:predicted PurR-regulated permease PerM